MGKWKANKSACGSATTKAGYLGHGAACWVLTAAVCTLRRTHRSLFHIQPARGIIDPVLPGAHPWSPGRHKDSSVCVQGGSWELDWEKPIATAAVCTTQSVFQLHSHTVGATA